MVEVKKFSIYHSILFKI